MKIAREQIFGPVMAMLPFDSVDELINLSNDTDYGLAAAVWTGTSRRRSGRPGAPGGDRVGQRLPARAHRGAVGRGQTAGHRARARPARHRGLPEDQAHLT